MSPSRRCRGAFVAVALATSGLAACTGDTADESLVVDDGGSAAEELAAAIESTVAESGRIEIVANGSMRAEGGPAWDQRTTVQFQGDDSLTTFTMRFDGADGPAESTTEMLVIDGSAYVSADTYAVSTFGPVPAPPTLPEGTEWIDITDAVAGSAADPTVSPASPWSSFGAAFLGFADVSEAAPRIVDGTTFRSFDARLTADELGSMLGEPDRDAPSRMAEQRDGEWRERYDAIVRYGDEHVWIDASVLVDNDGRLRRVTLEWVDEVAPEFASCMLLTGLTSTEFAQLDFFEVGEVSIEPPDPAAVLTSTEYDDLSARARGTSPTETTVVMGEEGAWSQGPETEMTREQLIDAVTSDAESRGVTPPDLGGMSDDDLRALGAAVPRFSTAMGDLTRSEMIPFAGLALREGDVEVAVESLSDEELVAAVDRWAGGAADRVRAPMDDEDAEFDGCPT